VQVTLPDGRLGYPVIGSAAAGQPAFSDTAQAGVYRLSVGDVTNREALFVANLEHYESDLRYLDDVLADQPGVARALGRKARVEESLRDLLPGRPTVALVDNPGQVLDVASTARHGVRLWDSLLVLVLLIALFEPWLANRIALRHYVVAKTPAVVTETDGRQSVPLR
jgi:hypothetical protein